MRCMSTSIDVLSRYGVSVLQSFWSFKCQSCRMIFKELMNIELCKPRSTLESFSIPYGWLASGRKNMYIRVLVSSMEQWHLNFLFFSPFVIAFLASFPLSLSFWASYCASPRFLTWHKAPFKILKLNQFSFRFGFW